MIVTKGSFRFRGGPAGTGFPRASRRSGDLAQPPVSASQSPG